MVIFRYEKLPLLNYLYYNKCECRKIIDININKKWGIKMEDLKYVFGPVPSRRLGRSLGISPIPEKTCNYSCVYCQLGRTDKMTNERKMFYKVCDIINEFKEINGSLEYDVVTIVGEGEPTLYLGLGELICKLKDITDKPIAVITNGALLSDKQVRKELMNADMVLPSVDACDEDIYKKIDRPHGSINYSESIDGLIKFSKEYKGQLLLEIMLVEGINNDDSNIEKMKELIKDIKKDRVYINTVVRPPAESNITMASKESIEKAVKLLDGISIDMLASEGFASDIKDNEEAILSIAKRHPMNQFEIGAFAENRGEKNIELFLKKLGQNKTVTVLEYKGIKTYRVN